MALDSLEVLNSSVVNINKFPEIDRFNFVNDSAASIELVSYKPNHLTYYSNNQSDGLAVFSELYYDGGWNAYIDGKSEEHFRVNYVLRALELPAGRHKIEFKFEPQIIEKGSTITIASSIALGIVFLGGLIFSFIGKSKKVDPDA